MGETDTSPRSADLDLAITTAVRDHLKKHATEVDGVATLEVLAALASAAAFVLAGTAGEAWDEFQWALCREFEKAMGQAQAVGLHSGSGTRQ